MPEQMWQTLKHCFPLNAACRSPRRRNPKRGPPAPRAPRHPPRKTNLDDFRVARLHRPADERRLHGQLAVAAIDQHAQPDALRPAQVEKTVHRRANRPASVKNIVHHHQVLIVHREGNVAGLSTGCGPTLERSSRYNVMSSVPTGTVDPVDAAHGLRDPVGKRNAAPPDPDQCQVLRCLRSFLQSRAPAFAESG